MPVKTLDISRITEALEGVPAAPRVVVTGNFGTPWTLLRAIEAILPTYRLYTLNAQPGIPDREGVTLETSFVGPGMRKNPRLAYYPSRLSLVPRLFSSTLAPDVVVLHTSTPRNGTVSLGVEVNILPAAVEAARARGGRVIVQMNPRMPYTYGDAVLKLEDVDYAFEVDEPLSTHAPGAIDETSMAIGASVASASMAKSMSSALISASPKVYGMPGFTCAMTMPPRALAASIAAGRMLTSMPSDTLPAVTGDVCTTTTSGGQVVANRRGTSERRDGT